MTNPEDRIGAERIHAEEAGKSCDFSWAEIDEHENPADILADEMLERFGARGLKPDVARAVAEWSIANHQASDDVDMAVAVQTIKTILVRIIASPRPQLEARCTQMAFGFRESAKESMRGVAKMSGVTVARVSALTKEIRETHGLALNSFNKSAAAAANYRTTNTNRKKL